MIITPEADALCVRCGAVLPVDYFIAGWTTCPACEVTDDEEAD